MIFGSFFGASLLVFIHLFACKFRLMHVIPRSRWLSFAGGVAVAYVLVHLLPELQTHQEVLRTATATGGFKVIAHHLLWLVILMGLVFFYGMEKLAIQSKRQSQPPSSHVFWLHIISYAVYNALLGYLLVREDRDLQSLTLYLIGIGLHFMVNDQALRQHHQQRYHRIGRWIISIAILAGWFLGVVTEVHEILTATATAFLAGGILLNTFKEELPEEREGRFWAFALGAGGYALILAVM